MSDYTPSPNIVTGTLSISGQTRPAGGIRGETSTGSASAGNIGEYISSTVASGSAVPLVNNTGKTITSISLTAGDWDIDFDVTFILTGVTATILWSSFSTTDNVADLSDGVYVIDQTLALTAASGYRSHSKSTTRLSLASTTTIYLVAFSSFTLGTETAFGQIRARRSANAK